MRALALGQMSKIELNRSNQPTEAITLVQYGCKNAAAGIGKSLNWYK